MKKLIAKVNTEQSYHPNPKTLYIYTKPNQVW